MPPSILPSAPAVPYPGLGHSRGLVPWIATNLLGFHIVLVYSKDYRFMWCMTSLKFSFRYHGQSGFSRIILDRELNDL